MGANRRPRAIGQFAWQDADVGTECLSCGLVTVYCDFEAAKRFSERGWSVAIDDAVKRFRCACGSRDLRVRPVPICKRPRPIPVRPAALRPIYREDQRSLRRRGPTDMPDRDAIEAALALLKRAIYARRYGGDQVNDVDVKAALSLLRPYCYDTSGVDGFLDELRKLGSTMGGHAETALTGGRRQLGAGDSKYRMMLLKER